MSSTATTVKKSPAKKTAAASKAAVAGQAQITIDGVAYAVDALSDEAKGQLVNIQFVEAELARLNGQLAVYQTAKNTYLAALKAALPQ